MELCKGKMKSYSSLVTPVIRLEPQIFLMFLTMLSMLWIHSVGLLGDSDKWIWKDVEGSCRD
jgi:hypothetical protein